MVRAKFECRRKSELPTGYEIELVPVIGDPAKSPENKEFFKTTPGGQILMSIVNPKAADQFKPGKEYYIDFRLAEAMPATAAGSPGAAPAPEAPPAG